MACFKLISGVIQCVQPTCDSLVSKEREEERETEVQQIIDLNTCSFAQAHGAAEAALLTLANLAAHPGAQQRLLELGALVYLVPLLFR